LGIRSDFGSVTKGIFPSIQSAGRQLHRIANDPSSRASRAKTELRAALSPYGFVITDATKGANPENERLSGIPNRFFS
jgi:hypothetical protein